MNAEIEEALESYLTSQLEDSFPDAHICAATKRAELPGDKQLVKAVARNVSRYPTMGKLFKAELSLIIITPVVADLDVAAHKDLVAAVMWAVDPVEDDDHDAASVILAENGLTNAIEAELDGYTSASGRMEGPMEQHTEGEWVTVIEGVRLVSGV